MRDRQIYGDRVVYPSNEVLRRLSSESCRARLISQIISGDDIQKEVTSFFKEWSQNSEPPYAHTNQILSHKSTTLVQPNRKSVYPSLVQGLRWNPCVSAVAQTEVRDTFKCKCNKCKTVNCPSKFSAAMKRPNTFKNNIVTYTNQYTMTRTSNDASCGSTSSYIPLPCAPEMNDAAVTASDVAVRDTVEPLCIPLPKCQPAPILKRIKSKAIIYKECSDNANHCWQHEMQYEAERDVNNEDVYFEPSHKHMKCFQPRRNSCGLTSSHTAHTYPPCNKNRKMLYNEGISDDIASSPPWKSQCSEDNGECGHSCFNRWDPCCVVDEGIPYSHRKSKYHKDCKHSSTSKHKHCELRPPPELKPFINFPAVIRKNCYTRPCINRSQYINLPRKMLSSEKDIEAFIKTGKIDA